MNPSHQLACSLDGSLIETEGPLVSISAKLKPIVNVFAVAAAQNAELHEYGWDLVIHMGCVVRFKSLLCCAKLTGDPQDCERLPIEIMQTLMAFG